MVFLAFELVIGVLLCLWLAAEVARPTSTGKHSSP